MDTHQEQGNKPRRPVHTERSGNIKAAVWEQENGQSTGYAVTVSRSFRKEGRWERSNHFFCNDLPALAILVSRAYEWLLSQENAFGPGHSRT